MLKLTRIAAVALIALAALLAVVAFMVGRKPTADAAVPVADSTQEAQTVTVVEAVARLPAGEPIRADGIRLAHRKALEPGAASDLASVLG
mgnify:CR=1 FL=1